jgi:signal transduction histidine kinase
MALIAFSGALLGSVGLLIAHYVRQPEVRSQVRFLFYALLLAVVPLVALSVAVSFGVFYSVAAFALLALPIIPGAYFFSIYRFQLGGSEFRANRLIAVYLYLVGIGTLLVIVGAALSVHPALQGRAAVWSTALGLLVALGTLYLFPLFQHFVERRLLAMPLPPMSLVQTYLARITTTLNEDCLVHLLKNEVLPTLLIRQSALLRIRNQEAVPLYSTNGELAPAVLDHLIEQLKLAPVYRAKCEKVEPNPTWVRLALALQVEGKLIGLWLLGRHDPDDLYSPAEVATLQTLAHQTALALANIDQAAQLQALNQANIERQEQERIMMAHFLHDAILNQAAVLYMSVEQEDVTPRVEEAYATLKGQIHQMVSSLRPPSLDLGLAAALEELTSELDQRNHVRFHLALKGQEDGSATSAAPLLGNGDAQSGSHTGVPSSALIAVGMQPAGFHYPTHVENQLFRIVQQACENAFRHAQASKICIYGAMTPTAADLTVADDGVGFVVGKPLELSHLLARKQFGLVHMLERAEYIGAELTLESAPGEGTRVRVVWAARG